MGIDSRGVLRGRCTRCDCTDFKKTKSTKCHCGHVPVLHVDRGPSSQHVSSTSGSPIDKPSHPKSVGNSAASPPSVSDVTHLSQRRDDIQHCYKCLITYPANIGACPSCHPRGNCENTSCTNMKYFDSRHGPFPYCSPSCRDKHLLPDYNKKLKQHIESVTVSNNSVSLLDQQIHKQDVKVEECFIVGNEPSAVTTDVSTALSRKYVSNSDNEKNPNSSMASKADGQPDHSIISSKDLIVTENLVHTKLMPKKFSCVYFYNDSWTEDDKYGLYVTGLTLGEETELELGDLIISNASGMDFTKLTSPTIMSILVKGSSQVKIFRKYNMKKVHEKINKEVKRKLKGDTIAFLLPNKQEAQVFGIKPGEVKGTVMVTAVDNKSIAQCSGIMEGDIIQFIGGLKDDTNNFTLTKVTKVDHVTTTCTELKTLPSAIGLILIINRTNSTVVFK